MTQQVRAGSPFLPKGSVAEWQLIYGKLTGMQVDEILTYAQLDELLGRDFRTNRSPLYKARIELQRLNHRTIDAVNNKGYRIVPAKEHLRLAHRFYKSGQRQVRKAVECAASANRSELTTEQRRRMDELETQMRGYSAMMVRLADRREKARKDLENIREETRNLARRSKTDLAHLDDKVDNGIGGVREEVKSVGSQVDYITDVLKRHNLLPSSPPEKKEESE